MVYTERQTQMNAVISLSQNLNLTADSHSLLSLGLTCSVFALALNKQFSCETCRFRLFLLQLHVIPSGWIPSALTELRRVVTFHVSRQKPPKNVKKHNSRQELRAQQSCQLLQGYLFISRSEVTALLSLSPSCRCPWRENGVTFVTCFLFCDWLEKGWIDSHHQLPPVSRWFVRPLSHVEARSARWITSKASAN